MPEQSNTSSSTGSDKSDSQAKVSLPKNLPGAVRINRRTVVLAIGAAVLFLVVIVSQGVLGAGEEDSASKGQGTSSSKAPPTSQQQPPSYASATLPAAPDTSSNWRATGEGDATKAAQQQARRAQARARQRRGKRPPPGTSVPGRQGRSSQQKKPTPREKAYQGALSSPLTAVSGGGGQSPASPRQRPGPSSGGQGIASPEATTRRTARSPQQIQQQTMNQYKDLFNQLRGQGKQSQAPRQASAGPEPGRSGFQERALQKASRGTYIASKVNRPISRYEVKAGTVVPAVLQTSINSDLPGEIRAQVLRPVYDHSQSYVLIPAGTTLLGSYSSAVATGQSRALVAWTRMIFPNGNSVSLPGLGGKDLAGASGLEGDVDNHYGRIFGTAALLAAVGGGLSLATPDKGSSGFYNERTPQEVMSAQVATELSRVATELMRQQINIKPTIKVEKGYRFHVYFNRDLAFQTPYRGELSHPRFQGPTREGSPAPIRRVRFRRLQSHVLPAADTTVAAGADEIAPPVLVPNGN